MKKVYYLLSGLRDHDVDWLIANGTIEAAAPGKVLVKQGVPIDALYLVLSGKFSITAGRGQVIATLGSGEFIGELSFLDSHPPNATVTATEKAMVLAVLKTRLSQKLRIDEGFAGRFYYGLGLLLADRLRATVDQLTGGASATADQDEIPAELLDRLDRAAAHFERIRERVKALRE